jgi:hypothetical protein
MASKKDYINVADILKGIRSEFPNGIDDETFTRLIIDFGAMFKRDNERFDLRRFEGYIREG